jgi:hypothetical protein
MSRSAQTGIAMNTKHTRTILALALVSGALQAQTPKTQALLMAIGTNGKQMAAYQWKQKTTIIRNASPAAFKVEEIRFDATGQPQRITLSQSEQKKMGPLRAHKAAGIKDDVQEVMQLAARYAHPQQLAQAIQKGEIWEGQGAMRVHARALILPVDEVDMSVNPASYLATRVDIKSQHEGRPVTIGIDYQVLPNGPNMLSRMTVQIPEDNIVVNVESFDFMRLGASSLP